MATPARSVSTKIRSDALPLSLELLETLRCPYEQSRLEILTENFLQCINGHTFPVIQGIPVLLRPDRKHTLWVATASWNLANGWVKGDARSDPWFVNTLGLNEKERSELLQKLSHEEETDVDPVISYMIGATSGCLYNDIKGRLSAIPIPKMDLEPGSGKLLDLGCNWGRWTIAATQLGYASIGIDPSLGALLAASRLARKLGSECWFVCGDGRFLPFAPSSFSRVFSYSVIQHLGESDAVSCLKEIKRVLHPTGHSLIQMPNCFGLRNIYSLSRQCLRGVTDFDVRYWSPRKMVRVFEREIGCSKISIDGFLGLGIQPSDYKLMRLRSKWVIFTSELLKKIAQYLQPLKYLADSLYVHSKPRLKLIPINKASGGGGG